VAWALGQIGISESLEALRKRLETEADPEVKEEINEAMATVQPLTENDKNIHLTTRLSPKV
jgi:hypothetical protein